MKYERFELLTNAQKEEYNFFVTRADFVIIIGFLFFIVAFISLLSSHVGAAVLVSVVGTIIYLSGLKDLMHANKIGVK